VPGGRKVIGVTIGPKRSRVLSFAATTLRFSVETPDLGDASEDLEIAYDGEALDIGFNASYLLEVLKYMPTDDIRLALRGPEAAVIVKPAADPSEETGDYLCLVMPLRLLE
jgi:DNA polymerase III subunit beta